MQYCRAFQDVTGNGVLFDWNLAGHRGARFTLFRETHHTEEDLRAAKAWLRRHRDVVEIEICDVEKQEAGDPAARPTVALAIFESECGAHARVFQHPERASAWRLELARRGWRREFRSEPLPDMQELPQRYFDRVAHRQSFSVHECPLEAA
jgi:hypothetical protein